MALKVNTFSILSYSLTESSLDVKISCPITIMKEFSRRDFLKITWASLAVAPIALWLPDLLVAGPETNRNYLDVLNEQTKLAIAAKASSLIRPTPEGAIELSDWLRNTVYSSASNICGPLAMYQQIGTTTYGVRPEDLWLANVRMMDKVRRTDIFSRAFPDDKFDNLEITTQIAGFDFNSINLQPGDFLYFMGANGRGSDHMMTISRRDQDGTLWAVTNYPDQNKKFIVIEVPVWNSKNPETSFVKEFAKGNNSVGFSSGQGGFMLWRLKIGEASAYDTFDHSHEAETLRSSIEAMARSAQGQWDVIVTDVDSGKIIAENSSNMLRQSASVIKVPLAMCVMSILEQKVQSQSELADYLRNNLFKGTTFDQSLTQMLVNSDEQATARMSEFLTSKRVDSQALLSSWGIKDTIPSYRISTEQDTWRLFMSLYNTDDGKILHYPFSHQYLLGLLSSYSSDDLTRLGTLHDYGVKVKRIYNKIGSVASRDLSIVADAGIVEVSSPNWLFPSSKPYFISINGQQRSGSNCTYKTLEAEFSDLIGIIAQYLKGPDKIGLQRDL